VLALRLRALVASADIQLYQAKQAPEAGLAQA
jgi:hypothetical protein